MTDILEKGHVIRGWLGVYIQGITDELQDQFGLPNRKGALITEVTSESPAEKGGLRRGDTIITFNNNHLHSRHDR